MYELHLSTSRAGNHLIYRVVKGILGTYWYSDMEVLMGACKRMTSEPKQGITPTKDKIYFETFEEVRLYLLLLA